VETAEPPLRQLVEESGYSAGQVFGIMRMAITGQRVSPPLFETMEIIGRADVIFRMKAAVELLTNLPAAAE
jgi:glutamyl-tRNA synthetase